jgi:AraC-like DNA-binding protein
MNFHIYRPAANLHPYVKHYYYWHDDTTGVINLPQNLLSLGDQYMVFLQQGEVSCQPCQHAAFTLPQMSVVGHFTCSSQLKVKGPVKAVVVHLNAYGSYRMLGINMHAISNYYRDLAKLPDGSWQALATQLAGTDSAQLPALLDAALANAMQHQAYNRQEVEQVANYLQEKDGHVNIAYLAARFRLSKPTLERLFLEVVGLPPKLYARMLRFKKAMQLLQQVNTPQWQPATAGAQYYNEAVLKQDYVYFNGQAPSFFSTLGTGNNNTAAVAQMPVHNTGIAVA